MTALVHPDAASSTQFPPADSPRAGPRTAVARAAACVGLYLLVLAIGWADFVTGTEIGFSLFYVAPIMLVSWHFHRSRVCPIATPCLSAAVWLLAELFAGHQYSGAWIPYWNGFIRLGMFLVIGIIVARLRMSNAHEKALSRVDTLTGAVNSRFFAELASREISRSARSAEPLSFVYLDVDNFKTVNDSLGHDQGDALLRTLIEAIRSRTRDIDVVARLGGDEFGILLPRTGSAQARVVVDKVRAVVQQVVSGRWNVTLSAGVITWRTPPESCDAMVKAADALMYGAKREGKDRVAFETAG
jgi:diguanylate cyclase (GGDEF)-like protein